MIESLDTGASYYTAEELEAQNIKNKGEFGGIGAEVTKKEGFIEIVSPLDGTPADEVGLSAGDRITQIDGKPVSELTLA